MTQQDFILLILPLRDRLFRVAWYLTRSRDEAEDIVQDVMIKVWDKGIDARKIKNLEAYCYSMARNLALNRLKLKANRQGELEEGKERMVEEGPQGSVEQSEQLELLYRLMEQLTSPQRDIIQLRDVEGMSYADIAVTLGLSEEQVKVYLFRARKKIKELYLKVEEYGLQKN